MDWVACVFVLVGIYRVSKKSPEGFILIAVGAIFSAGIQADDERWGLVAQSICVVVMNAWAYWKWGRGENRHAKPPNLYEELEDKALNAGLALIHSYTHIRDSYPSNAETPQAVKDLLDYLKRTMESLKNALKPFEKKK